MTLHLAIEKLLNKTGHLMTAGEIADALNKNGWYQKKDGSLIHAGQIRARIAKYPHLFKVKDSLIGPSVVSKEKSNKTHIVSNPVDGLELAVGLFEDMIILGEWYRKMQADWYQKYTKADYKFISDFLACQLTLENLIERDIKRIEPDKTFSKSQTFGYKIKALNGPIYLLYHLREIFEEIQTLRNKLVHELNYLVSENDFKLLYQWNDQLKSGKTKEPIKILNLFTSYCLMAIELDGNPIDKFSNMLKFKFKRRIVSHREKKQ